MKSDSAVEDRAVDWEMVLRVELVGCVRGEKLAGEEGPGEAGEEIECDKPAGVCGMCEVAELKDPSEACKLTTLVPEPA